MAMLSIVIPVYNEAESLAALYSELTAVADQHGYTLDIILVDDGSTDDSWRMIRQLALRDGRVRGLRFRRNFGKAAALSAGFEMARGELVFTLDADLQDNPKEIPRFLAAMDDELDVVSGWKQVRYDPWHKVGPSRIFNWLVSWLTGVKLHDHNCGFKCYRREIFDEVRLYGELHRFVPVLAAARGYRVGEIVVDHRERKFGRSKYGAIRILKGFLDLLTVKFLTGFGQRPQHVLGTIGLLCFLMGGMVLLYLTGRWCVSRLDGLAVNDFHLHQSALFHYSITALLLGTQLMSIGFLAELITAYQARDMAPYSIAERVGGRFTGATDGPPAAAGDIAALEEHEPSAREL
jgi:dolichol-phosphate mannosyltransferase